MRREKPSDLIVIVTEEDLDLQGIESKPFLLEIERVQVPGHSLAVFQNLVINVLFDQKFVLRDQLKGLKQELAQEAILVVRAQVDFEVV